MKYVFSSADPARVGLVQSVLEAEGIELEVRNEAVSQVEVGMPFATELWVLRDEDQAKACALIQALATAT